MKPTRPNSGPRLRKGGAPSEQHPKAFDERLEVVEFRAACALLCSIIAVGVWVVQLLVMIADM